MNQHLNMRSLVLSSPDNLCFDVLNSEKLKNMKVITIQDSNLTKVPEMSGVESVERLLLANNQISSISFSTLPRVEVIDLKGHPLTEIDITALVVKEGWAMPTIKSRENHSAIVISRKSSSKDSEVPEIQILVTSNPRIVVKHGVVSEEFTFVAEGGSSDTLHLAKRPDLVHIGFIPPSVVRKHLEISEVEADSTTPPAKKRRW